jgi:phage terminase large subunit-like protein
MTLQAAGLPIREFPQTVGNTTRMGQVLFDLLNERNLKLYPAPDLRAQAMSTVGIETARGTRIGKEKSSKKIDAIVALAMACVSAIDYGQSTGLFVGVDLATKHDSAAVVAVQWTPEGALQLVSHRIWQPTPDNPLDMERTVEWYLRELHSKGLWANRNHEPVVVQLRRPGGSLSGWSGR